MFDYHGLLVDRSHSGAGMVTLKKRPYASETPCLPLPHASIRPEGPARPGRVEFRRRRGRAAGIPAWHRPGRTRDRRFCQTVLPNGSVGNGAPSSLRHGRPVPGASATESRERVPRSWVELSIYWIGEARGPFTSRPSRCKALNSRASCRSPLGTISFQWVSA